MRTRRNLGLTAVALALGWAAAAAVEPAAVARKVEALKPRPEEAKWQRIPWLVDLQEGLRQAKAEKRPVLIWATDDDPLERC